jgi:hypothetical protein
LPQSFKDCGDFLLCPATLENPPKAHVKFIRSSIPAELSAGIFMPKKEEVKMLNKYSEAIARYP